MLRVHQKKDYKKVVSTIGILKGTIIIHLKGELLPFSNKYSIQINETQHLHPSNLKSHLSDQHVWPYLNHSCNPNTFVNTKKMQLIALRDIHPNEEITFDYGATETHIQNPFQCGCNSKNCRGLIS